MKKLLSTIVISLFFSFTLIISLTFVMRVEDAQQKQEFRNIANSIALNTSGQGLSMSFLPESETKETENIKVLTFIKNGKKDSCKMYVMLIKDNKHYSVEYPCQVQDGIIYSVGLDYAQEKTFLVMEYVIIGCISFFLCLAILASIKIIKS